MKFSNAILTILILFTPLCPAQVSDSTSIKVDCQVLGKSVADRRESLMRILASLETILGSGAEYSAPLSVIFQVDLSNPLKIEKRIAELEALVKTSGLAEFPEIEKYTSCFGAEAKKTLNELSEAQSKVNENRLAFLKLERDKRVALLNAYTSNRKDLTDSFAVENQLASSKAARDAAQASLMKSETESSDFKSRDSESTLTAQAAIDKFNVDLENEHIRFIETLKEKGEVLKQMQSDLVGFTRASNDKSNQNLSQDYKTVSAIWAKAADRILELFSGIKLESEVSLPDKLNSEAQPDLQDERLKHYLETYATASIRQQSLAQTRSKMLNELKVQNFKLLRDSGSLRAKLLHDCDAIECRRPRGITQENLEALLLEIKIVPLKFLAGSMEKWLEVKAKINSGFDGWFDLTRQAFLFFLLLLIPIFLVRTLSWISNKMTQLKKNLVSHSMIDFRNRVGLAIWISRLNPFVPSVGMIMSIGVARMLIGKTDLSELAGLLFYLQIYFIYRAAKVMLTAGLELSFSPESIDLTRPLKLRIEKTATRIARLIFIEYVLLHLTEDAVRRALAYQLFSTLIFWTNTAFAFNETARWADEISASFESGFRKIWPTFQPFYKMRYGKLLLPPMLVAIAAKNLAGLASSYLIRMDLVKRLLSEVLRKRLESAEKPTQVSGSPPQEYLKAFDYYLPATEDIFIEHDHSITARSVKFVEVWLGGKRSDDLIILVGNRGMGKSTTLDHIHRRIKDQCDARLASIPAKLTRSDEVFVWISDLLKTPITSVGDIREFDLSLTKKVVLCVDDIQNLFLSAIGKFDAYKTFLDIISLGTSNIYWCLTVNSRSWAYLKGVFGKEHFYGKVIDLPAWKDFEIQKLILKRHQKTHYSRSFDKSIKAYDAEDRLGQQAESQFFRLLWGQSRGNPRSALMYWISAVSCPGPKSVHVGIPSFVSSSLVGSMSDDALFLLSSIARHESLTHDELRLVTGISDYVIRKCINEALDKNLIWLDESYRIRISSRAQYVIDYFLIGKNFLYE